MITTATIRVNLNNRVTQVEIGSDLISALLTFASVREGATPKGRLTVAQTSELARLGLIGPQGGLTRRGTYARMDISEQIEAALGW
jgi:hypothetical protein